MISGRLIKVEVVHKPMDITSLGIDNPKTYIGQTELRMEGIPEISNEWTGVPKSFTLHDGVNLSIEMRNDHFEVLLSGGKNEKRMRVDNIIDALEFAQQYFEENYGEDTP